MKQTLARVKTPEEIERLARGGVILRRVLEDLVGLVRPGMTGADLATEAERRLRSQGAEPSFKGYSPTGRLEDAFPSALCVSVNSAVVHGIPTRTPLRDGDIVGLDLGCRYEGLYTDTATTVPVGNIGPEAARLIAMTRGALAAALAIVRAGVRTGDIGAVVQRTVEQAGFAVVRDLVGHGVGYDVHEEPSIPNFGKPGTGVALPAGMVIAIEPMVIAGKHHIEIAPDGWTVRSRDGTLAAHEEVTVVVNADGAHVLTTTKAGVWKG